MDATTARLEANAQAFRELRGIYADEAARREAQRNQYLMISAVVTIVLAFLWTRKK
jgi:hypothetical protein